MTGFHREDDVLSCDGVSLAAIAHAAGTPVHVYSGLVIADRYAAFDTAFAAARHRLHYAIKANSTLAIVGLLSVLGAAADANSGGEIEVALRAGFSPNDIVFTGVGKSAAELARAIALGVAAINAESPGEVERIAAIAAAVGRTANVAVRINPDVEAGSHPHISTGHRATKFGMSITDAAALVRQMSRRDELRVVGLHVHVGSQVTRPDPIAGAVRAIVSLACDLAAEGIALDHLDVGGGLGVPYRETDEVMSLEAYARTILSEVGGSGLTLRLEPGRWIVAPAGVLLTEVVDLKRHPDGGWFVVVDAGMTELLRPALYGAYHRIEPVAPREGVPIRAEIVGPVCETSDTLGRDRLLPPVQVGDLLAVRDTGAYGAAMSSNYNRRPTAAEVLVTADGWRVVRRRQSLDEMLQWDVV
jgi:diaminopimelate decarboxylase